jgi:hypothetical protein
MTEDIPHIVDCHFEVPSIIVRVTDNTTAIRRDANFVIEFFEKVTIRLFGLQRDGTLQLGKAKAEW